VFEGALGIGSCHRRHSVWFTADALTGLGRRSL
jgi:hypothetical protein